MFTLGLLYRDKITICFLNTACVFHVICMDWDVFHARYMKNEMHATCIQRLSIKISGITELEAVITAS